MWSERRTVVDSLVWISKGKSSDKDNKFSAVLVGHVDKNSGLITTSYYLTSQILTVGQEHSMMCNVCNKVKEAL